MKQNIPRTLDCLGLVEDWHVLHCFATNGETYGGYRMEMNEKWYAQRRILWIGSFLARAIWRAIWIHLLRTCPTLCPLKLSTCFPKIGRWSEIIINHPIFQKSSEYDPKALEGIRMSHGYVHLLERQGRHGTIWKPRAKAGSHICWEKKSRFLVAENLENYIWICYIYLYIIIIYCNIYINENRLSDFGVPISDRQKYSWHFLDQHLAESEIIEWVKGGSRP
jgi:hypothetical protein